MRWLRGGQIAAVTALLSGLPATRAETNSSLDSFRQFLSATNWVTDLHFSQSGNLFSYGIGDAEPKPLKGFVHYRAALQPDTWFLLNVSNTPGASHNRSGTNAVIGASLSNYWSLSADRLMLAVTPRSGQGHEGGGMSFAASNALFRIEWALSLGILQLKWGSVKWLNESNFVAEGNATVAPGKRLRGTVHVDPQSRVSGLTYTVESDSKSETFDVSYKYFADRAFPPFEAHVVSRDRNSKSLPYTNRIHSVSSGLVPSLGEGFRPSDFQNAESPALQYLSVRSADSNVLHLADGRSLAYAANAEVSDDDLVSRPRASGWFAAAAFCVGIAVVIGIMIRRYWRQTE